MISQLRPAIVSTILFTLLLGLAYPLAITGISRLAFPFQAGGSLLRGPSGQVIGSALIAQGFTRPEYLHPRPSAAGSNGYDASASSGSNYGPLNPDLIKRERGDADALRASGIRDIPADAVTASGSGLDPDISPAYALVQAPRIAAVRHADPAAVRALIAGQVQGPWLGIFGQPRINVLKTNLALDARFPKGRA